MKRNNLILIATAVLMSVTALSSNGRTKEVNLLTNGQFKNESAWELGPSSMISEGICRVEVEIEKYHRRWLEICRQKVSVEPNTDYRLTASARMSLEPLQYGVFVGVRVPKGKVLKDKNFLLFRDEMTPLCMEFNSGDHTSLTVFCGSWIDQSAVFEIDDFKLVKIKK